MTRFARWSAFRWGFLLLLLAGAGLGACVLVRTSNPPPVVVLRQPVQMPVPLRNRLAPATRRWAWAWHMENALFGNRKPVNLRADFLSLSDPSGAALSSLALRPPSFSDTNGLRVWLLGQDQLKALRGDVQQAYGKDMVLRSCRVSTADGIEAAMFQGQSVSVGGSTNQAGLAFGCFAQVRSGRTDLIIWITFSELVTNEAVEPNGTRPGPLGSIRTNLDTALRLQLPKGKGFLVLDRPAGEPGRKRFGVIVDPL